MLAQSTSGWKGVRPVTTKLICTIILREVLFQGLSPTKEISSRYTGKECTLYCYFHELSC